MLSGDQGRPAPHFSSADSGHSSVPTLGVSTLEKRRKWQPTPVFLPGEPHGQRSLVGYSPWGCKESDTTEWLSTAQQGASVVSDQLFEILWTIACQAALSMGFSRQYRSGLPFPSPGDLPNQGIEPASLMSPALVGEFFTAGAAWEAQDLLYGFFFFFFFFLRQEIQN